MDIKKKRIRSPNFPFINLEKSLGFIRMIYSGYNRYFIPLKVVGEAISVSTNSYLAQHVSAFSQFGLIETEGEKDKRQMKVSDLAFKIINDERPNSSDRDELIKKAALMPTMFNKVYNEYPDGLPEKKAIEYKLKVEYQFNPNSVNDFINIFESTMTFAKVYNSDIMVETITDKEDFTVNTDHNIQADSVNRLATKAPVSTQIKDEKKDFSFFNNELKESFPITLKDKKKAVISFTSLPIKQDDINLIKKYLDLMADNWSVTENDEQ